jgi:hypothetical protein
MSYDADLYIMLPCHIENKKVHEAAKASAYPHKDAEMLIGHVRHSAEKNFEKKLCDNIKRRSLGEITLVREACNNEITGEQKAFVIESRYASTNFVLITIAAIEVRTNLTDLMDQAQRGDLKLIGDKGIRGLSDWLSNAHGLRPVGKAFFAPCLSKLPRENDEHKYIITGEAFSERDVFKITSKMVDDILNEDHSLYSFYELYMSSRSVAFVMKEFSKEYSERVEIESLMIFTIELIILKITAINSANSEVLYALADTSENRTSRKILDISDRFTSSLPLWDTNHFRYMLLQELVKKIETAFRVPVYLAEFEENRRLLEHDVNVRNLMESEKETRVIMAFAAILSLVSIIPLIYSTILYLHDGHGINFGQGLAFSFAAAVSVILLCVVFRRRLGRRLRDMVGKRRTDAQCADTDHDDGLP